LKTGLSNGTEGDLAASICGSGPYVRFPYEIANQDLLDGLSGSIRKR